MTQTWAKLSTEWYQDPVIRAAAAIEPMTLAVWPILIAKAKHASSLDNIAGTFQIVLNDLAAHTCTTVETLKKILENLVDGELITTVERRLGIIELELTDFVKWQTPRGTKKERDERYRENASREKAEKNVVSTTLERRDDVAVTSLVRQSDDLEREREREGEKKPPPSGVGARAGVRVCARQPQSGMGEGGENPIRLVFDHWAVATGRVGAKLSDRRERYIRLRLDDGFTVEELKAVADAFAADPWHRGENEHGKSFDTIEVIYADAAKVERGLELANGRQRSVVVDVDEYVLLDSGKRKNVTRHEAWMREQGFDEAMIRRELECLRMGGGPDAQEHTRAKHADGGYDQ